MFTINTPMLNQQLHLRVVTSRCYRPTQLVNVGPSAAANYMSAERIAIVFSEYR